MIDTVAIRRTAINLAIQGKLFQEKNDEESAKEYVKDLMFQKSEKIKSGELKNEKALPQIRSEEIPFEIPDNWTWVRLGDICTKIVDGDHNPPSGTKEKTKFLMLSAQNINNDRIVNLESVRYLSEEVFEVENKRTKIEYGDVLLTIVGTLGRSCVFTESINACFQRSVAVITTLINSDYLKYVFDSDYIQKFMVLNATGAAQLGFYLNKVEKLLIPVPPLYEQINIAKQIEQLCGLLGTIDELQQRYSSDLEVLKSKIIDAGIQGKLTEQLPEDGTADELLEQIEKEKMQFIKEKKAKSTKALPSITEDELPFEIPTTWKWVRLSDLVSVLGDGLHGTPSYDEKGDYYFINGNNLMNGQILIKEDTKRINEDEWEKYKKPLDRTTVFVSINGTLGNVAFYNDEKVILGKSACYFNMIIEKMKYYVYWILKSNYFMKYAVYSATGVTIKNVSLKAMNNLLIPLPPLSEQKRIVEKIDEILSLI